MTTVARVAGRALLAVGGLTLIAFLVRSVGPERVAETLWQGRVWLPLIILLETMQLASDFLVVRLLLGKRARDVPRATWLRSSALAYAMMIVLPAGRAAGEVARASLIARHVGAGPAASASTRLQGAYVFAIGVLSAVEAITVGERFGAGSSLALLLAANALIMMVIAVTLVAILWNARIGRWLDGVRRRFAGSSDAPATRDDEPVSRTLPWRAAAICLVSRAAQAAQYGVILYAVGGALSLHGALVTHGIDLVGATMGDLFPNQIGVVDGAYRAFAADIGFAHTPARALSVALLSRVARLPVAATCFVVIALSRRGAAVASPPRRPSPVSGEERVGTVPLA